MKESRLVEMRNRIDVLESAVTYCLTNIKELERYIQAKAAEDADVIDAEEVVVE